MEFIAGPLRLLSRGSTDQMGSWRSELRQLFGAMTGGGKKWKNGVYAGGPGGGIHGRSSSSRRG